jgi:hypothetical protein
MGSARRRVPLRPSLHPRPVAAGGSGSVDIRFGWRTTRPRPQRLQEDKHDASLRATAGLAPFVRAPDRIGPAPGGRSDRTARTTARPEAGERGSDPRLLMASGHLVRPTRPRRPTWRPRQAGPETLLQLRTFPASPWRSSNARHVALRARIRGQRTWRPTCSPRQADAVRHRFR